MSCGHMWEIVNVESLPSRTVYLEYCIACRGTRMVIVWEDGETEYVYNVHGAEAGA